MISKKDSIEQDKKTQRDLQQAAFTKPDDEITGPQVSG